VSHRAFTLIELLVVIAIIAILAAILFPVFARADVVGWSAGLAAMAPQAQIYPYVKSDQLIECSSVSGTATLSNRYGVCDPHLPLDNDSTMELKFSVMNAAGISSVRCVFAWPDMEPSPGAWDFARTDLVMQKASAHGVRKRHEISIADASVRGWIV
jgi:prepilin-type N-terminal cleavage/methylation domain-containing protein